MTIPVEYLLECSQVGLENLMMSRLDRLAQLRREVMNVLEQMVEESTQAALASWMMEHRDELCRIGDASSGFLPFKESFDLGLGEGADGPKSARAPHNAKR